ncbi:MAG: hypothetical protein V2A66_07470 [Pseudomonadota bacterium]
MGKIEGYIRLQLCRSDIKTANGLSPDETLDDTCVKFFKQFRGYIRENCRRYETRRSEKAIFEDESLRKVFLDENIFQCTRDAFVSDDSEESAAKWENLLESIRDKNIQLYCAARVLRNLSMQDPQDQKDPPNWEKEAKKLEKTRRKCKNFLENQQTSEAPAESRPPVASRLPAGSKLDENGGLLPPESYERKPESPEPKQADKPKQADNTVKWAGVGVLGTGLVAGVVGAVLLVLASSNHDKAANLAADMGGLSGDDYDDKKTQFLNAYSSYQSENTAGWAMLGLGAAALATGLGLFLWKTLRKDDGAKKDEADPNAAKRAALWVAPSLGGLSFGGEF